MESLNKMEAFFQAVEAARVAMVYCSFTMIFLIVSWFLDWEIKWFITLGAGITSIAVMLEIRQRYYTITERYWKLK